MKNQRLLATAFAMPFCAISLIAPHQTHAASGNWNVDADGNWSLATNWAGSTIADGADNTATFDAVLSDNRTVTLDSSRTIGGIVYTETNNTLTIAPSAAEVLTLDVSSGMATIDVTNNVGSTNGDLTISAILAGSDGLSKVGNGDLLLTGANTFTGGVDLSAGRIVLTNGANEASALGDAGNTLTFSANADLHNNNGTVTFSQNIQINTGVTGRITGAFGERFQINGVLSGDGDLHIQGFSAGYDAEFLNTANTFTGSILIDGTAGPATMGVRSLVDSTETISLASDSNNGGIFEWMNNANAAQTFDSRQFVLVNNGNSGTNLSRQAAILNNESTASEIITINTDLAITGTGHKHLVLGGGNVGDNAFNGVIIDAIGINVLDIYKQNNGKWILGGVNTYEGNTYVNDGTLELADGGELLFIIGDDGVNNAILGDASNDTLNLNGNLRFDLSGASTILGDSWAIVDVANLTESYGGTFGALSTLGSFSESAGVWTIGENGTFYEFEEATGVLTVVVPEPGSLALLGLGGLLIARRRRG